MTTCPECNAPLEKVIYAGLPGKICMKCCMILGLASYAAMILFTGRFMVYEGSYWRALWHWLRGTGE